MIINEFQGALNCNPVFPSRGLNGGNKWPVRLWNWSRVLTIAETVESAGGKQWLKCSGNGSALGNVTSIRLVCVCRGSLFVFECVALFANRAQPGPLFVSQPLGQQPHPSPVNLHQFYPKKCFKSFPDAADQGLCLSNRLKDRSRSSLFIIKFSFYSRANKFRSK
jgi:hypothetical protein